MKTKFKNLFNFLDSQTQKIKKKIENCSEVFLPENFFKNKFFKPPKNYFLKFLRLINFFFFWFFFNKKYNKRKIIERTKKFFWSLNDEPLTFLYT